MHVNAGVMSAMVENPPHVRADPTQIEHIVQRLVDRRLRADRIVVAVVRNVQQQKRLRQPTQQIDPSKSPRRWPVHIDRNPAPRQHRQTHSDLGPHHAIGLRRHLRIRKEPVQPSPQHLREGSRARRVHRTRRWRILMRHQISQGWFGSNQRFDLGRHRLLQTRSTSARRIASPVAGRRSNSRLQV